MTSGKGLKIDTRRKRILELLRKDGQVRVTQLCDYFGATPVTIRNDLDALEKDGYLQRTQGGAIQTVKNFYNLDAQQRMQDNSDIKRLIASQASTLINDGETLLINSGSTTYFTAIELKQRKNLNIVTNSISVAMELDTQPTFRVILLGGEINSQYSFTYGKDAEDQLKRYKADKAILSMDGICWDTGLTTYHAEEATIDCLMMERSRETIIVADSSKWRHESFAFVSEINKVNYWVTDINPQKDYSKVIEQCGIKIIAT